MANRHAGKSFGKEFEKMIATLQFNSRGM